MAAGPVRLDPCVPAAEMAIAAPLPNRELRQATLFFLTLYPGKLRPDQRSMNRTFLQFDRRFNAGVTTGVTAHVSAIGFRDIVSIVYVVFIGGFRRRVFDRGCDTDGDW